MRWAIINLLILGLVAIQCQADRSGPALKVVTPEAYSSGSKNYNIPENENYESTTPAETATGKANGGDGQFTDGRIPKSAGAAASDFVILPEASLPVAKNGAWIIPPPLTAIEKASDLLDAVLTSDNLFEGFEAAEKVLQQGVEEEEVKDVLEKFVAHKDFAKEVMSQQERGLEECTATQLESLAELKTRMDFETHYTTSPDSRSCLQMRLCGFVTKLAHRLFELCEMRLTSEIKLKTRSDTKTNLWHFLDFLVEDRRDHSISVVLNDDYKEDLLEDPKIWGLILNSATAPGGELLYFGDFETEKRNMEEAYRYLIENTCDEIDRDANLKNLYDLSISYAKGLDPSPDEGNDKFLWGSGSDAIFPRRNRQFLKMVAAYKICKDVKDLDIFHKLIDEIVPEFKSAKVSKKSPIKL